MNILTKVGQQDNIVTYEHVCDTKADMANIEKRYITLGTVCIVLTGESEGLEVYMADSKKEWHDLVAGVNGSGAGAGDGLEIHLCAQNEVDENGMPDIEYPLDTVLYLVPSGEDSGNLYNEYIYVNGEWESFGSGNVESVQPDWLQADSSAADYIQNKPYSFQTNAQLLVDSDVTADLMYNSTDYMSNELPIDIDTSVELIQIEINDQIVRLPRGRSTNAYGMITQAFGDMDPSFMNPPQFDTYPYQVTLRWNSNNLSQGVKVTIYGNQNFSHVKVYNLTEQLSITQGFINAVNESIDLSSCISVGSLNLENGTGDQALKLNNSNYNSASGNYSVAEGFQTYATGECAHAEGRNTSAYGNNSHSEGFSTTANGNCTHSQGVLNLYAQKYPNWVSGTSYAVGDCVINNNTGYKCIEANSDTSFTIGKWRGIYYTTNAIDVVGNGYTTYSSGSGSIQQTSNAYMLEQNGTAHFMGDVFVNCDYNSTGGSKLATETYVTQQIAALQAQITALQARVLELDTGA